MKFEIYKFNKVTSTNDIAIDLITKKKSYQGAFMQTRKLRVEALMGENGNQKLEIFLVLYFFP